MVEINKLRKADQLKGKATEFLSAEDFNKLAMLEEVPHYILTNPLTKEDVYCFSQSEIDDWFKGYVQRRNRKIAPQINFMTNEAAKFKVSPVDIVPPGLANIKELQKIPFSAFDSPSGVYFLCKGADIVYIGQAKSILHRLSSHKREKEFDSVYFISCHIEQLTPLETALIHFYRPILNKSTLGEITINDQGVLAHLGVSNSEHIENSNI